MSPSRKMPNKLRMSFAGTLSSGLCLTRTLILGVKLYKLSFRFFSFGKTASFFPLLQTYQTFRTILALNDRQGLRWTSRATHPHRHAVINNSQSHSPIYNQIRFSRHALAVSINFEESRSVMVCLLKRSEYRFRVMSCLEVER